MNNVRVVSRPDHHHFEKPDIVHLFCASDYISRLSLFCRSVRKGGRPFSKELRVLPIMNKHALAFPIRGNHLIIYLTI